jgi:hypothetical protein
MITLGIFGDSTGRCTPHPEINEKHWVNFVEETNKYEIKNFSEGQTSLWYSYNLFLNYHRQFEKIIFIATIPNRLTLPKKSKFITGRHHAIEYTSHILQKSIQDGDTEKVKEFQLIQDYWSQIHDTERDTTLHHLMIENIKKIRPDAIVYPSHPFGMKTTDDLPILTITIYENKFFNSATWKNLKIEGNLGDCRNGHIIEDNAKVVANMFLDKLDGKNTKITTADLVKPTKPYDYYLKMI